MPAVSVKQQRFFQWLKHNPGAAQTKGVNMSPDQISDFADTSTSGLPKYAPKKKKGFSL